MQGSMHNHTSSPGFDHDNGGGEKRMDALFGFDGYFNRYGVIQVKSILHIAEETLPV